MRVCVCLEALSVAMQEERDEGVVGWAGKLEEGA